jgi:hypothetical protein
MRDVEGDVLRRIIDNHGTGLYFNSDQLLVIADLEKAGFVKTETPFRPGTKITVLPGAADALKAHDKGRG